MDAGDWETPISWWEEEADIYFNMSGGDDAMLVDENLKLLFDVAYFDQDITPDERADARDALREYLSEEYGVDFDAAFDWEAYREWYASV